MVQPVKLGHKTITDSMHCQEMMRRVRIGFELLAQFDHVRVDSPRIREKLIPPNGVQNHIAGQGAVGMMQKEAKQVVLSRCELEFLAFAKDHAAFEIDFGVAEMGHLAAV